MGHQGRLRAGGGTSLKPHMMKAEDPAVGFPSRTQKALLLGLAGLPRCLTRASPTEGFLAAFLGASLRSPSQAPPGTEDRLCCGKEAFTGERLLSSARRKKYCSHDECDTTERTAKSIL